MPAGQRFFRPLIAALVALAIAATVRAEDPLWLLETNSPPTAPPTAVPNIDAVFAPGEPELKSQVDKLQSQVDQLLTSEAERARNDSERPSIRIAMQLQADSWLFSQDDANKAAVGDIENGSAFRRARVWFRGEYGQTEYGFGMDFALSGRPSFLDVYAGFKDVPYLGVVRFGHFFEPFSLERYTSNRLRPFMERSLIDSAFAPARNLGAITFNHSADEMATWAVGVFHTNSDNFGDEVGDEGGISGTTRVTRLLWYDEASGGRRLSHVGVSYSYRDSDDDLVSFASQPEARIGAATPNVPNFVDTGDIPASFHQLIGVEAAWAYGPFKLQSEYVCAPVNAAAGPNLVFDGWYVYASWFLTGEHRPYNRATGVFGRVVPKHDFIPTCFGEVPGDRGCGAWELAVRLSHLDLNDHSIQGGRLTDLTVDVSWYLNPWMRAQFDYIHAFLDDPASGESGADLFGMRVNYDF